MYFKKYLEHILTLKSCKQIAKLLINQNALQGSVPSGLCELDLQALWADCLPNVNGIVNNECTIGCCTFCTIGKKHEHGESMKSFQ